MRVAFLFYGVALALRLTARFYPAFRERLEERDLTVQMKLQDESRARYFELRSGRIRTRASVHPEPDVTLFFKNSRVALNVLMPPQDYGEMVHAGKTFQMGVLGKDELVCWWMQTLNKMLGAGWKFGVDAGNGETRYVNNTNGGPVHVYVKDDKIVRVVPIAVSYTHLTLPTIYPV